MPFVLPGCQAAGEGQRHAAHGLPNIGLQLIVSASGVAAGGWSFLMPEGQVVPVHCRRGLLIAAPLPTVLSFAELFHLRQQFLIVASLGCLSPNMQIMHFRESTYGFAGK